MAQTGYTPISLYYSATSTSVPLNTDLVAGELALNTADGKLFYKDSSNVVQVIATKGAGTIGGSNTQVQFNNSGALGGSSSLTWDGTYLTANSIKDSALTSTRVVFAGASGLLSDSASLTWSGSTLTATDFTGTVGATTRNSGYFTGVRMYGASSGYVGFQGAAAAGSTTYTLPSADGSNGQALVTNGSGTLSWGTAGITTGKAIAMAMIFGF